MTGEGAHQIPTRRGERLEKRLARVSRREGIDQERLRRWVSFLAICGVLEKAVEARVLDGYYIKGGVAMELRFAQRARATKPAVGRRLRLTLAQPWRLRHQRSNFPPHVRGL
jgi:hypothetical protein